MPSTYVCLSLRAKHFPVIFLCFLVILSSLPSPSDDSGDDCPAVPPTPGQGGGRNSEVQSTLRTLSSKVEDLTTCNDLIVKHGSALQRYQIVQFDYFRKNII